MIISIGPPEEAAPATSAPVPRMAIVPLIAGSGRSLTCIRISLPTFTRCPWTVISPLATMCML